MIRTLTISLALLVTVTGCSSSTKVSRAEGLTKAPTLDRQGAVYVMVPANGVYGGAEYKGSGGFTSQAIRNAFTPFASRVDIAEVVEPNSAAMLRAKSGRYQYLVDAAILHWEDRNTEWSGKPDVIGVRITLFDVASARSIDVVQLDAKSKWATLGGDHPQDLLADPINAYVASLYGAPSTQP